MESKRLRDRGKRFLEAARTDPWHANIVLQLAESVGDSIDSLSAYLDMLITVVEAHDTWEAAPGTQKAKYRGWLGEIGEIDRWTRPRPQRLADGSEVMTRRWSPPDDEEDLQWSSTIAPGATRRAAPLPSTPS